MAVRDVVQAAAGNAGGDKLYVEDVFSTYLYTGNGTTQTINNGIDLDGEGGLVWIKSRNNSTFADSPNVLTDSVTGFSNYLISSQTTRQQNWATDAPVPTSTGFDLPINGLAPYTNYLTGSTYASWTFRKAPKFFDVVTYTGDGVASRSIPHNLDSVPGVIIIKKTNSAEGWYTFHRSASQNLFLNTTSAGAGGLFYISGSSTSTDIVLGTNTGSNNSGDTYVAYLFAHDAGGFGNDGQQNVVSCGSAATNSGGNWVATLGYEPQWILWKSIQSGHWEIADVMRGAHLTNTQRLFPNLSNAEADAGGPYVYPTATGFVGVSGPGPANSSIIYIAIRRGPMKTPESGTEVYGALTFAGDGSTTTGQDLTLPFTGFDMVWNRYHRASGGDNDINDRLRGIGYAPSGAKYLNPHNTNAEGSSGGYVWEVSSTGVKTYGFASDKTQLASFFKRAPGFFDVVAYTGTGVSLAINHNLNVAPEFIITKRRDATQFLAWSTYHSALGNQGRLLLNASDAASTGNASVWDATTPTSTAFYVGDNTGGSNVPGGTFVAYLFATCPGVSKVGSYTGTGTTLAIDCGFSAGARFVLIKRTDSTGDWYVWDTARGIVAGNDPYLLLNSTAAEVTSTDYIDPSSAGFEISSTAPVAINASGGSYIFLAIA